MSFSKSGVLWVTLQRCGCLVCSQASSLLHVEMGVFVEIQFAKADAMGRRKIMLGFSCFLFCSCLKIVYAR